jgi:hypothetical protein
VLRRIDLQRHEVAERQTGVTGLFG